MAHGNNVEGHGLQARFRSFLATILARSSRANQFQNDEVGVPSDPDLEYREARRREFRRARILDDQRRERQRAERILELTEKARAREGAERRADLRLADIREQYPSTQGRAAVAGGHPRDGRPIRKDARKPDSDRVKNIVPFDVESGREGAPLQDLESSDHYWTGVRGHGYFDGAYRSLDAWGRRHPGELVRIVGELKEEGVSI